MNERVAIAPVRKSIRVNAPIAHAFEVFTSGLTRWWPYDHGVGKKPIAKVMMEPRLGGHWLEIAEQGTHAALTKRTGGIYRSLFERQVTEFERIAAAE